MGSAVEDGVMGRHVVGTIVDFPEQHGVPVTIGDRHIALFRVGAEIFAVADSCPHRHFPLNDGVVIGRSVQCRTHRSCFSLETGALECGPARRGIQVYPVFIVGDRVEIEVPD